MPRIACVLFALFVMFPFISVAETIDVQIKGVDDGKRTSKQQDYNEAVLFAKREAIERAGVKIKALTTSKDFVVQSDYIETKAEALLLPGYNIIDVGYQKDGTYLVILVGKVKAVSEGIDSKELRYAKSLVDRGQRIKAKKIVENIISTSKDGNVVAEAMYCKVLWNFSHDEGETLEQLKAYYPNSKYVSRTEVIVVERENERKEAERKSIEKLAMKFVYIEPGTFTMGSPSGETGHDSSEIQHHVTLTKGFYIQTTEITQGQWKAVMGSINNPSHFKNCGKDCPVEQVSWNSVQKFIHRLNQRDSRNTYRLPTEAEWEYAARAGSSTAIANGNINEIHCSYDAKLDAMGWYCGNAKDKTHPVAQKQANSWGLYDMHGNVSEWCQDWYGVYPSGAVTDPTGPSSGSRRVLRGGAWNGYARYCRSAARSFVEPDYSFNGDTGFRLVRER